MSTITLFDISKRVIEINSLRIIGLDEDEEQIKMQKGEVMRKMFFSH